MKHNLIYYGNEILRVKAEPVQEFDSGLNDIVEEMFQVMKKNNGIGLAGPQIGVSKQIVTIEFSANDVINRYAIINPVITKSSQQIIPYEEGCLSVPGIYEEVQRPAAVNVEGYDVTGGKLRFEATDIFARVLQHEIDHLDGILFIDRIEEFIRKEYNKELKKIKKMNRK